MEYNMYPVLMLKARYHRICGILVNWEWKETTSQRYQTLVMSKIQLAQLINYLEAAI